jgi:hypothetical protein
VSRRRLPSLATRRIEASRRHGPFDPRYRPRHSSAPAAQITRAAAATAVEAWEDEGDAGALTTSSRPGAPPGIARKRPDAPEMETAEDDGLAVVDAPTALKGFLLALRLPRYLCRNKQGEDGRWRVSVQLVDPESLPAFLNVVQQWLRREQIKATQVCVGRQAYRLTAKGPPQRERAGGARQGTRAGW